MRRRGILTRLCAMFLAILMVIGMMPEYVRAEAVTYSVWLQGYENGALNTTQYGMNESAEISIPLVDAGYNSSSKEFEKIRLVSDPAVTYDDYFEVTNKIDTGNDGIYVDEGTGVIYMKPTSYDTVANEVSVKGEYRMQVKYGEDQFAGGVESVNPENIYQEFTIVFTGDAKPQETRNVWAQNMASSAKYEMSEDSKITIPLMEAGYNASAKEFDNLRLVSDPAADESNDYYSITGGGFSQIGNDGIYLDGSDGVLYLHKDDYAVIKTSVESMGSYSLHVVYGQVKNNADFSQSVDPEHIYKEFDLLFTGDVVTPTQAPTATPAPTATQVPVKDVVTFTNTWGQKKTVKNGETLNITTVEAGTFTCGNYSNSTEASVDGEVKWATTWDGPNDGTATKPIWIAQTTGKLTLFGEGTVTATATRVSDGEELCSFTITAAAPVLEDLQVWVDGKNVTGSTYTVAGHQWKTIDLKGKLLGTEDYVTLDSKKNMTITADQTFIDCDDQSGFAFAFQNPGSGLISVTAYGVTKTFMATSTYVALDSISLEKLQSDVTMHNLIYGLGNGDNYYGLTQAILNAAVEVKPVNASYYTINWSSSDESITDYHSTHANGFIGHKEGKVTITAAINDQGTSKSDSKEVNFKFKSPVAGITMTDSNLTVKEDEDLTLPMTFTPAQPSYTAMKWEYSGDGEVEIYQKQNGEYADYASTTFVMTGMTEGTVNVTGTPVCKTADAKAITFTVTVTAGAAQLPDYAALLANWQKACKFHYSYYYSHKPWAYGDEWDIIGNKRAGLPVVSSNSSKEATNIEAYLASIKSEIENGNINANMKPTDLERVALALYALGKDASNYEGFDFITAICNSSKLSDGSNEAIYALLALDAQNADVPANAKYGREKIIDMILSYQATDGGFGLSSNASSSVDMTAMALQALAKYKSQEKVAAAIDKALTYLKNSMDRSCDYGTSESIDQVIAALTALGEDITSTDSQFTVGKTKSLVTALVNANTYWRQANGFKHVASDTKSDHMATQQALLALAAWQRYQNGENSLYDMTDIQMEKKQVSATISSQAAGGYTLARKQTTITAGLAAEYGFAGVISPAKKSDVTALDALVALHIDMFGDAFTKETAGDYLAVGLTGWVTKVFGETTSNFGFTVNGMPPSDGNYTSLGMATGYMINQTVLKSNDNVEFFLYQDEDMAMDYYTWFEDSTGKTESVNAVTGTAFELTLKGYMLAYGGFYEPGSAGQCITEIKDSQIVTIDENGAMTNIADKLTGSNGKVSLTFNNPGTYVLGALSSEDTYVFSPWCTVTVTGDPVVPTGMTQEELEAFVKDKFGFYKLDPKFGTDSNVVTVINDYITKTLGEESVSVTLKTTDDTDYVAADGAVTYFDLNPLPTFNSVYQKNVTCKFTFTSGSASYDYDITARIGWNQDKLKEYIKAEADGFTWDTIKGENTDQNAVEKDLTLPQLTGASYPSTYSLASWTSSNTSVISINDGEGWVYPAYIGKISQPVEDTEVTLTATFACTKTSSWDVKPADITREFKVTVKGKGIDPEVTKAEMLKELKEKYTIDKILAYPDITDPVDPANITGDIKLPIPSRIGLVNKEIAVTSSDSNAIKINGYRGAVTCSPDGDKKVTITVTLTRDGLSVSEDFDLTVKAMDMTDVDKQIALMEAAKASFFDGINDSANANKDAVTSNLHAFYEVTQTTDGKLKWVYALADATDLGIQVKADSNYSKYRSSNKEVIAPENLLVTRPEKDTKVTIEATLYSPKYESAAAAFPTNEKLQKLVNQTVSVEVTVLGTVDDENRAAAKAVDDKIKVIGKVTLDSKTPIEEARAAYEALNADQKALVSELDTLKAAEAAYEKIVADIAAAKAVDEKIAAIGEVTVDSKAFIEDARKSYERLSADQKALVENLEILVQAEKTYEELITIKTGWQTIDGEKYYILDNKGTKAKNWKKISGNYYYFDLTTGAMKSGWQKLGSKWYYFGKKDDGVMKIGWQKINNKWYYLSDSISDGAMKSGWQKINKKWYYLGSKTDGSRKIGWQKINKKWYYLSNSAADGSMKTGWQKVGSKWYYMYSSGAMAANTWIGKYYVNGSGAWTKTK